MCIVIKYQSMWIAIYFVIKFCVSDKHKEQINNNLFL